MRRLLLFMTAAVVSSAALTAREMLRKMSIPIAVDPETTAKFEALRDATAK